MLLQNLIILYFSFFSLLILLIAFSVDYFHTKNSFIPVLQFDKLYSKCMKLYTHAVPEHSSHPQSVLRACIQSIPAPIPVPRKQPVSTAFAFSKNFT